MYNLVRVSGGILYMGTESSISYPSTGEEAQFIKINFDLLGFEVMYSTVCQDVYLEISL